jgi:feruloyl esterase
MKWILLIPAIAAAQPCELLMKLALPDVTITSATSVAAGKFAIPGGRNTVDVPAFCRVAGTIKPEVKFELWMPAQWNKKLLTVGNGGLAGSISYAAMVAPLAKGYATSSTDTGHAADSDGHWASGRMDRVIDFAHRSVHVTTQADKALIAAFYGSNPAHSYFSGCSQGGQEAMTEAQRYPKDYDGIIAGDPANYWVRHYIGAHLWVTLAMQGDAYIPANKIPALADAVNNACDALDGVKDGILNDPRKCHFDPATLLCKGADSPSCLTAPQVAAVKKIYSGGRTADGEQLFPGIVPGGEAGPGGWGRWISGSGPGESGHANLGLPFLRYVLFEDAKWDYHSFRWDRVQGIDSDVDFADAKLGPIFNNMNPDLRAFQDNGGKMIHYHGWSDPDISPLNSINYYESVAKFMGAKTGDFYRLFMVPGMQHCTGGPGPSSFDMLDALDQWVDHAKAPEQIIASHVTQGKVDRTRPLCPYPQVAKWKGTGSTDQAENFTCVQP